MGYFQKTLLIIFFIFLYYSSYIYAKDYELLDRIKVTVEGDVVTEREIHNEIINKYKNIDLKNLPSNEFNTIKDQIIKLLVEKKLLIQYAEKINLTPTEKEIDFVIQNILKSNNLNLEDLEKQLKSDDNDLRSFKEDIKFKLTIQKIKDREIMPYVNISEFEIDGWIKNNNRTSENEYKISHILIKHNNDRLKEIINIINSLKNKDQFSTIALKFSDGPNAENGGDLGWNKLQDLPEIFLEFVSNAKSGEISKTIESSNVIHFLKVDSIKTTENSKEIIIRQYKFQQVLFKNNEITNNEEQQKKLENIKNLILDGLNFSEAVKMYSDEQYNIDPEKLEWVNFDNLLPEFRNMLSEYPNVKLIGPFRTDLGWHLVKVYDFRETDLTNEAERQRVKIQIARNKTEIRFSDWLDALIKNSKIEYFEND